MQQASALCDREALGFYPGIGEAVAARTILRSVDGKLETWADVSRRVAEGNSALDPARRDSELETLRRHMETGTILLSGRHLQHGDSTQPARNLEVFTNCSTAIASFLSFYLLMNGCFRRGTQVRMGDGSLKSIEDVREGEEVVALSSDGRFQNRLVEKTFVNGPKPMVRVVLENEESIVCTEDHLFLTDDGWVEARDLEGRSVVDAEGSLREDRSSQSSHAKAEEPGTPREDARAEDSDSPRKFAVDG